MKYDRFDKFMGHMLSFFAGMGFLAALIALGIWWGQHT